MILYHGSREIVKYPEIRKAQYHKDFWILLYKTSESGKALGKPLWDKGIFKFL